MRSEYRETTFSASSNKVPSGNIPWASRKGFTSLSIGIKGRVFKWSTSYELIFDSDMGYLLTVLSQYDLSGREVFDDDFNTSSL
jgi:hypothetical protein